MNMIAQTHPSEEKLQEISARGFTVISDVVSQDVVPSLRDELQRCIYDDLERFGVDHPDAWMVHNLMVRSSLFAQLLENPTVHAFLSAILSDTCILYAYTSSSMKPRGSNYSHRIHVDSPRFIPGYVTNLGVVLALDDFHDANGATWFLPGSHTRPEAPSEDEFFANAKRVYPKSGDAVVFNARTWHFGGNNTTDNPRHAITMNVCRSYMRQRFDYPRLVPSHVVQSLGQIGRRFLGFNVRMPTSLDDYYLSGDQRLYKPNQG